MATEVHLGPLEAAIIAIVDERIARALAPASKFYSTDRRELYPPGKYSADEHKARRQARDRIKAHAAHERCGTGRATVWRVARDAYHARRAPAPVLELVPAGSAEEIARRALDAAKLRPTRAAR